MLGTFFKAVVKVVLIFGYEIWVLTPHMIRTMRGFQHRVARWMMGKQPWQLPGGGWDHPPLEEAMWEVGLEEVEEYIMQRQNTVIKYNATHPVLDQCEEEVRQTGMWVYEWWCYQGSFVEIKSFLLNGDIISHYIVAR